MAGAITRGSAWYDLAAFGDEGLERAHVFVIDGDALIGAKAAYLAAAAGTSASTRPLARAALVGPAARAASVFATFRAA